MLKLRRPAAFYVQPWFWTLAIVLGQYYGVWWQSLGAPPPPAYESPRQVLASADAFTITIVAPGLHSDGGMLRATN